MNDRFKFRVWDKGLNRYLGKDKYEPAPLVMCNGNIAYLDDNAMRNYIVQQCTGLKDKNGTLIYENDFIKNYDYRFYKVIWQDDAACFLVENIKTGCKQGIYSLISLSNDLEVIGNIYENKELLNE